MLIQSSYASIHITHSHFNIIQSIEFSSRSTVDREKEGGEDDSVNMFGKRKERI